MKLATVSILEIEVGSRHRVDMGDIEGLAESMKGKCEIINPLAVCEGSIIEGRKYKLLAGGRRFAAAMYAGIAELPVRIYPAELTEEERLTIELIENLQRKDFTVEEAINNTRAIHEAQIALKGKTLPGPGGEGWSQKLTAELLGEAESEISRRLALAKAAETNPEIAKASTMKEAQKLMRRLEANKKKSAHAKGVHAEAMKLDPEDVKVKLMRSYNIGDCLQGMHALPPESFDIAEIDPPYAIDFREMKMSTNSSGSTTMDYNEISADVYMDFMQKVITESYRLLKKNSWLILWHADTWRAQLLSTLRDAGFKPRDLPAIWVKADTASQTMQPKKFLAHNYECFIYAYKGDPDIQKMGRNDVFSFKGVPSNYRSHPTERPVNMIEEVLKTFSPPGSRVLVPFAGSGNTILAANNLMMDSVGFDLSEHYRDLFLLNVNEGEVFNYKSKGV